MQLGQLHPPGFCQMPAAAACVPVPPHPTVPPLELLRPSRQPPSPGSAPAQHESHRPREGAWAEGTPCPDVSPRPTASTGSTCALQTLREHNKNCLGNVGRWSFIPHTFISWHTMVKPSGRDKLWPSPLNSCDLKVVGPDSCPTMN